MDFSQSLHSFWSIYYHASQQLVGSASVLKFVLIIIIISNSCHSWTFLLSLALTSPPLTHTPHTSPHLAVTPSPPLTHTPHTSPHLAVTPSPSLTHTPHTSPHLTLLYVTPSHSHPSHPSHLLTVILSHTHRKHSWGGDRVDELGHVAQRPRTQAQRNEPVSGKKILR